MAMREMETELQRLKMENEALRLGRDRPLTFSVTDKGGVAVSGLVNKPYVFYAHHLQRLMAVEDDIKEFIEEYGPHLRRRNDDTPELMSQLEDYRIKVEKEAISLGQEVPLTFNISENGGVAVYGLGRFPITFYAHLWKRLLAASADIKKFIEENADQLGRDRPLTFSLTEYGGVAVHGLGKFPLKLYANQWQRLLSASDSIKEFIEQNADQLGRRQ